MLGFLPISVMPISALTELAEPQIAVYTFETVLPPRRNVMKGY